MGGHFRHRYQAFGLLFGCHEELPGWPAVGPGRSVDIRLNLRQSPPGFSMPHGSSVEPGDEGKELRVTELQWRAVLESAHLDASGEPLVKVEECRGIRRFLYHDGASFYVDASGRDAWLAWPEESTLEAIWLYFCGPVMTWILRLHGRVVLHAAAVEFESGAILLAGPSGAGKSTTAASFALAGHALLSDDTAALFRPGHHPGDRPEREANSGGPDKNRQGVWTWPDSPRLRLWPESDPAFENLDVEALPLLCDGWEKRAFDAARFEKSPRPVIAVYCLQPGPATSFSRLSAREALPILIANGAAAELADREMRRREFELLSDLALDVPVVLTNRPDGQDLVPALIKDLESRLEVTA